MDFPLLLQLTLRSVAPSTPAAASSSFCPYSRLPGDVSLNALFKTATLSHLHTQFCSVLWITAFSFCHSLGSELFCQNSSSVQRTVGIVGFRGRCYPRTRRMSEAGLSFLQDKQIEFQVTALSHSSPPIKAQNRWILSSRS